MAHIWTSTPDRELTVDYVKNAFNDVQGAELWVTAACVDRLIEDIPVQRVLLEVGIQRSQNAVERSREAYMLPVSHGEVEEEADETPLSDIYHSQAQKRIDSVVGHFRIVQDDAQLCFLRDILLERLDRLNTFVEISQSAVENGQNNEENIEVEWEDDPWAEEEESSTFPRTPTKPHIPISLPDFLSSDLLQVTCLLASMQWFSAVRILLDRHAAQLWPHRFTILGFIPENSHPVQYRNLLPGVDASTNCEFIHDSKPWRPDGDWSQSPEARRALELSGIAALNPSRISSDTGKHSPLQAQEISQWYAERVQHIISSTGMIDMCLSLIQHGGSQGVPDLDQLGEELLLLSRLVYDAPGEFKEDWTLDHWRSLDPPSVIRAYLAHSSPETVAKDIMKLVMPYMFVLESRAERGGQPDPLLVNRLLYDYILTAPIRMAGAIFESSKPTLPSAQRIIRDDEDMARLALACLYGSDTLDEWTVMSNIFECLPAWDNAEDANDAVDSKGASLGTSITPPTARSHYSASDLFAVYKPLSRTSLSRALDMLDVHLESAQILSRWSIPAPLQWFLCSRENAIEQREWATRMVRRSEKDDRLERQEDWELLLDDMLKLSETGAFGLLPRHELICIFLSGMLSTGKLVIAKTLLNSSEYKHKLALDPDTLEEICIACSREFYDGASSGNYKFGHMKLAYECLEVPPFSGRLLQEKEFVEATSRLSSFNIMSRPGIPISPIEIRLTKDRLSLVSRLLACNADAYKHSQVILDLVRKLGFRDDPVAEVKTLAMLTDTALQAEDFARAYETSERMVNKVLELRVASPLGGEDPKVQESIQVCWVACLQLGRQPEFDDLPKKLSLLSRALELCPADNLPDVLTVWRKLEKESMSVRQESLARRLIGANQKKVAADDRAPSLASRLRHVSSSKLAQAPDIASRTLSRVAATFPFVGARGWDDAQRSTSGGKSSPDVSAQATRVLQKGIGWLIGAEDG